MKATGIVRSVDQLGRIVIPKELRTINDIKNGDSLEVYTDGDFIMLKKYEPACIFCGEARNVKQFHGKNICAGCLEKAVEVLKSQK